jgi:hypothetical protein
MPNEEEKNKSDKPAEPAREERDKHNALWAGVIFFMVLIIVLWVMNLNMVFKRPLIKANDQINIDKLSQDFQKAFNQAGAGMTELKKIDPAELSKYPLQLPTSTTETTIKN